MVGGRTLGHEGVGTVVEAGSGVETFREGDRVLLSCISACGRCAYCRRRMYGQCLEGGGWILGHLIDGTQAEYARIRFADNNSRGRPRRPWRELRTHAATRARRARETLPGRVRW